MKNLIENTLCLKPLLGILALTFLLASPAMSSGFYKWTDEEGKVHYGSRRPADAQAEKLKLHLSEPATKPEQAEEDKKVELTGDDKANQERVIYCTNERNRLKTIEKNMSIHEKDAAGKTIKLGADARNQRLNKIKANISKYCK